MSENKKYTIVVKHQRVEVSEAVYRIYHKSREAERYQYKLIHQFELSLERFQDDGVNVEFLITRFQPSIEDKLIEQEQFRKLWMALDTLTVEERLLIHELFFNGKSERILASETGIPNMTIHDRKCKVLKKLKKLIKI
jgi:RNA polymerase sigma factor (sigma-70 family)